MTYNNNSSTFCVIRTIFKRLNLLSKKKTYIERHLRLVGTIASVGGSIRNNSPCRG